MIANADRVRRWVDEMEVEAVFADGLDDAVIGVTRDKPSGMFRVVYDTSRVLQILMNDHGMDQCDAIEHLHVNVIDAHVGEGTPVWMFLPETEEVG